jgi:inosine/xanthosine triphosphate pyrophosphatase family protein
MPLYFITTNQAKFKEVRAILPSVKRLNIDLPEIQSLDSREIIKTKLKAAHRLALEKLKTFLK